MKSIYKACTEVPSRAQYNWGAPSQSKEWMRWCNKNYCVSVTSFFLAWRTLFLFWYSSDSWGKPDVFVEFENYVCDGTFPQDTQDSVSSHIPSFFLFFFLDFLQHGPTFRWAWCYSTEVLLSSLPTNSHKHLTKGLMTSVRWYSKLKPGMKLE